MLSIELISLSRTIPPFAWGLGRVLVVTPETTAVAEEVEDLITSSSAAAVLFWDSSLGVPDQGLIQKIVASPVDCWHAGLRLGTGGLPGILDFISPTWMLSCDPPSDIEATSWRLSLRACLVKMEVLRKLGGPRPEFLTLEAAGLEMGHRWIRRGALMRHVPALVEDGRRKTEDGGQKTSPISHLPSPARLPFADELRFAYYCYGRKWAGWALFRAVMTGYATLPTALRAWRSIMSTSGLAEPAPFRAVGAGEGRGSREQGGQQIETTEVSQSSVVSRPLVSVLIPTVDRYSYLRTLLGQLRQQTVQPLEIIIVDQTGADRRQPGLFAEFSDLPLKVIYQAEPGQCTSRNAGLQMASGEFVLFIDDDDEVPANLIEAHLSTLAEFKAEVSCGVAEEMGAGPLPADFRFLRASDVFPTNNTMIHRDVLRRSGLFDLAYNRRPRADGDLGMRVHLAGAAMILNPAISVLHHHAPAGGLRKHKARTITYAMSRGRVFCQALASSSEFYLAGRYFPHAHLREMYWQTVLGTFSIHGGLVKRLAKLVVSAVRLPGTFWELRSRIAQAKDMAAQFPKIPELESRPAPDPISMPSDLRHPISVL